MASPVDSARVGTNVTTATTGPTAISVGSPVAGTLLIVMVRFAAAPGTVTFTGYTQFAADTSDASDDDTRLYYRWADGSEGVSDNLSTVNSVKFAAICWEITGAENMEPLLAPIQIGTTANINPAKLIITPDTLAESVLGDTVFGNAAGSEKRAQQFIALGSSITNVSLVLGKVGGPTDDVVVELQTDSSGQPSGTVVTTIATVAGTSLTTTTTQYDYALSQAVTYGTRYWVVVRRSGALNASNHYALSLTGLNSYAGLAQALASGTWTAVGGDYRFAVTGGTTPDSLLLTVIGLDSETATATQPAGYSNLASANSGTGGAVATNCMIWGASKQATAASDDPAAWTSTAPNSGVTAWTIAIPPPAAAAAPGPAAAMFKPPLRRRASRYLTFR